jgi:hypothetical protein
MAVADLECPPALEWAGWSTRSLGHQGVIGPVPRARADSELTHIARVEELSANGTWLVGWQPDPPIGTAALRQLAGDPARPASVGGM